MKKPGGPALYTIESPEDAAVRAKLAECGLTFPTATTEEILKAAKEAA
jgi:hypothetical protein